MTSLSLGLAPAGGLVPIPRRTLLDLVETTFAAFAILFMTGGLTRLLTGGLPEDIARETPSPLVQVTALGVYALTTVFLALRLQRHARLIVINLLLFAPVLLALASTAWSPEPDLTLRRGIALMGTTLLGLYIALRFDLRTIATLLFAALGLIVGTSFLLALLAPGFGIHQTSDVLTAHHAGLWRGLFWHKNNLGPMASMLTLTTLALWREIDFGRWIKLGAIAVSAVVVVKSGSSQALFQFVVLTGLLLAHGQFSRLRTRPRLALVALALPAVFLGAVFFDQVQGLALEALGRDATLSSRIYIWRAAIAGGMNHMFLGNGYDMGWAGGAATVALQRYTIDVGHAHNGYLQLWLDLGVVGLAVLALVWIVFVARAFELARHSHGAYLMCLYFLAYYFISNYVTSFIMNYQDLYWLLLSLLFVLSSRLIREGQAAARA